MCEIARMHGLTPFTIYGLTPFTKRIGENQKNNLLRIYMSFL